MYVYIHVYIMCMCTYVYITQIYICLSKSKYSKIIDDVCMTVKNSYFFFIGRSFIRKIFPEYKT